jgi:hypothetical protein
MAVVMARIASRRWAPVGRLLVQVGGLDGRARLGGEQDQGPLVVGVEVLAAVLLGQVEVAVDPAAGLDRDPEEGPHRRVVGRQADRAGVLGDVVQAQLAGVVDEHAQDPAAVGDVAHGRPLLGDDPGGDEVVDGAVPAQHAHGPVAGPGQPGGQLDDPLEGGREGQVGGQGQPALQQALVPFLDACHRRSVHAEGPWGPRALGVWGRGG